MPRCGRFLCLPGSPRRLGDITAHDGAFSPDGRQMLFASGNSLYLAKSDGSAPRKLLTTPGNRILPDFRRMARAFDSPSSTRSTTPTLSGKPKPTEPVFTLCFPAGLTRAKSANGRWTPDGAYYLFTHAEGSATNIWALSERSRLLPQGFAHTSSAHYRPPGLRSRLTQPGRPQDICYRPSGAWRTGALRLPLPAISAVPFRNLRR